MGGRRVVLLIAVLAAITSSHQIPAKAATLAFGSNSATLSPTNVLSSSSWEFAIGTLTIQVDGFTDSNFNNLTSGKDLYIKHAGGNENGLGFVGALTLRSKEQI